MTSQKRMRWRLGIKRLYGEYLLLRMVIHSSLNLPANVIRREMHLEILGKLSRIRKNQQGLTGVDFLTFYNTLRKLFKMTILLTLLRESFGQRFPMKKSLGGPTTATTPTTPTTATTPTTPTTATL